VIATGEPIRIPAGVSQAIDYEAELAVVIGKGGHAIRASRAMEHVHGYTIFNDVTARDVQRRHKQWLLGKSVDTFGPMGPWLVTADELDGANTRVRCWVNGELRQDARTSDLIFPIATLIEAISSVVSLVPGDVIATGTPGGVGIGFDPPKFLKAGDRVRIEIDGIGVLENPVR
jgi:2-keto-4-pentenoate hydratase/2-oxohepta-3-ene-1,7-dioic acid hydratase in catechol pathway